MKELQNLSVEDIQNIENVIGYTFKSKVLLEQAFTRSSFANEHKDAVSNEVLEFFGDRALDIIVTKTLSQVYFRINADGNYKAKRYEDSVEDINEGFLSAFRSSIVKKETLAHRIEELDLAKYLLLGSGDSEASISMKEDLFEAICGAVAIDSKWDMEAIDQTVRKMLELEQLIVEAEGDDVCIQTAAKWYFTHFNSFPKYEYEYDDMFSSYHCCFEVTAPNGEGMTFTGTGETRMEARNAALRQAYDELFTNGERFELFPEELNDLIKPSWLKVDASNAINVVQEMEQKKLITDVQYEFEQSGNDENGNPQWTCTVSYRLSNESSGSCRCGVASSKTEIKKHAALMLIQHVFEDYHVKNAEISFE